MTLQTPKPHIGSTPANIFTHRGGCPQPLNEQHIGLGTRHTTAWPAGSWLGRLRSPEVNEWFMGLPCGPVFYKVEKMEKLFPTLIVLDVLSAVPYAVKSDMKMTVYWLAAGLLTYSVTWM
jgi:hypothetical protein